MATGRLEFSRFVAETVNFIDLSSANNDTWDLKKTEGLDETAWYLMKRETKVLHASSSIIAFDDSGIDSHLDHDLIKEEDSATAEVPTSSFTPCTFEYHVVYSSSYCVPVLYLNVYKTDGSLVSLEELWQSVPTYFQDRLQQDRWTFLTQQEHPILRRPFYQLHPCHTADLMKKLPCGGNSSKRFYLLTWLSAVGPVVNLTLPLGYAQMINENDGNIENT